MTYPILSTFFFLSILAAILFLLALLTKPKFWTNHRSEIMTGYICWFTGYAIFILFFTGPNDLNIYPSREDSPYKLPWKAGVGRFVAQGNNSFTSHRDFHLYAWDFVMANGTEILAARDGTVSKIEDVNDGIGLKSNFIIIEHEDGQKSAYAHIRKSGALVKIGEIVKQGQPIALSGMVGQTVFPHVHFYVINKEDTSSIPISFKEVPGGVPLAGHFYTSTNGR